MKNKCYKKKAKKKKEGGEVLIIHSLSRFEGFIYNQLFVMRIIHRFFISYIIQECILSTYLRN